MSCSLNTQNLKLYVSLWSSSHEPYWPGDEPDDCTGKEASYRIIMLYLTWEIKRLLEKLIETWFEWLFWLF